MKGEHTAYYALAGSRSADFWTLLHPPYTAWNLSYVAIGASLAPVIDWEVLALMLSAFFFGTGIAAHALDELQGRPLQTGFSARELKIFAAGSLLACLLLAAVIARLTSSAVFVLFGIGVFFVLAYNLEWWDGLFHTDVGFALAWGAFPILAGCWTQCGSITPAALAAAGAAALLSLAQRSLSTSARFVRRKTITGTARFTTADGDVQWDKNMLLDSWEHSLRLLARFVLVLAAGLLMAKLF